MTPLKQVFSLTMDSVLDYQTFMAILRCGHTRVPVFEQGSNEIVAALLNTKDVSSSTAASEPTHRRVSSVLDSACHRRHSHICHAHVPSALPCDLCSWHAYGHVARTPT